MRAPHLLPAVVVAAALALSGCGGSGHDTPNAAAAETPLAIVSAAPSAKAGKAKKGTKAVSAPPTVAPEVVVPSTSDAVSERTDLAGWQGNVITELRKIDPRLVTTQTVTIKKVRATCTKMETGAFETKITPLIIKRFSSPGFTVSAAMADEIYSMFLQLACYTMHEETSEGGTAGASPSATPSAGPSAAASG